MLTINLLESALGVDLDSMANALIADVIAPCTTQTQEDGNIAYFHFGFHVATETVKGGVDRIVLTPYGNRRFVDLMRERLKNIAMRLAVESL